MLSGPSTPPSVVPLPVYSSVVVEDDSGGRSGSVSTVSVVRTVWSKSSSAVTLTTALPGPTSLSSIDCTPTATRDSYSPVCPSRRPSAALPPTAESTWPSASMTATSAGSMPSMPAETRCTIDCTFVESIVVPGVVRTNTDAVGSGVSSTKTLSSGRASLTVAASTPLIAPMVRASSPSRARW